MREWNLVIHRVSNGFTLSMDDKIFVADNEKALLAMIGKELKKREPKEKELVPNGHALPMDTQG